ncbi:MAG: flavin reductase family protein [Nitrososphaerales archaeon]|nr:flavin reductase family protein [Nitrososphaerales archaeon]
MQTSLKEVMRVFPQGVTVVTSGGVDGPKGLTVSAFTSVSLDPPLVLISLAKSSAIHDVFAHTKEFAINFLAEDQKPVSDRFAGRVDVKDRFDGIGFHLGTTGSPIIQGVRAVIECVTWRVYDGGDHSILVGEVVRAEKLNNKAPLVYYTQQYTTTEHPERAGPPSDVAW